jgi:hypothetical protein
MTRFYEPDLTVDSDSPFVRDASDKLVRRGYWMDMYDGTLVMVRPVHAGPRRRLVDFGDPQ